VLDVELDWDGDLVVGKADGTAAEIAALPADVAARQTACAAQLGTAGYLGLVAQSLGADTIDADGVAETIAQCNNGLDDDADTVVDDGCATDYDDPDLWQDLNDLSGAQLSEDSTGVQGALWVLAFVSNDENVDFEADEGVWVSSGTSTATCNAEQDCDHDGVEGDEIVVDKLIGNSVADRDEGLEIVVEQAGVDIVVDYTVVGEPDGIALALLSDEIVQEGCDAGDCSDEPHLTPLDSSVFTDGAAEPEKNGLLATVTDDDGTELAGIYVNWTSDDTDVANLNLDTSITWALESGTVAANLFCGDEIGTATITADIGVDDDDVDVTVIGVPDAMTLSASPASITCDGVNSSTVSADLVDSEGNSIVDGTDVRFEVVALGIADPITATTAGGAATSTITPLSLASAGVVVLVTVLDAEDDVALEGNIRIDCAEPVPVPVAPPVVPVVPAVVPPGTGDGGCLP